MSFQEELRKGIAEIRVKQALVLLLQAGLEEVQHMNEGMEALENKRDL
jgi:hypothetical protein